MTKYDVVVGQVYNSWTVIDETKIRKKGFVQFKVRCICGNEKYVDAHALIYGKSKRCNKCNSKKLEENPAWKGFENVPGKILSRCKRGAKNRNLEFNITIQEINTLLINQNFKCALSQLSISFKDNTASIDRIDSSKGYVLNNIQLVHKDINLMKNHFNQEYFITICSLISIHKNN